MFTCGSCVAHAGSLKNVKFMHQCCVIANLQPFVDKNLDDVLPKFRQRAKHFTRFCTLLKILHKIFKWDSKNNMCHIKFHMSGCLSQ